MSVRVRFAPSPTGHLHIGGLRAALFNYYFAKQQKGTFVIRIEDTDHERNKDKYTKAILDAFSWCNIASDEPIVYQSRRYDIYKKYIDILLDSKAAYYSDEEDSEGNISKVIKCKINRSHSHISFFDIIRGEISFPITEFDDFIIVRSDGTPLYNLVVVIDDIEMNITHVIRGEEHLPNTPKQLFLYQAFKKTPPAFAHLPLILGPDRKKLSKRDAATAVMDYKQEGIVPEALCMYLLRLGWAYKDQEIFTTDEIYAYFKLEDIHLAGAIFDHKKLLSINGYYLKKMSDDDLFEKINILYSENTNTSFDPIKDKKIINLYKDRAKTLKELAQFCFDIKNMPIYNLELPDLSSFHKEVLLIIEELKILLLANISLKESINQIEKKYNFSKHTIYTALRYAFLGKLESPSILSILAIFNQQEILEKIDYALNTIIKNNTTQK